MALLAPERAGDVIDYFPEIDTWAVGGHSMGGIAACEYAHDNAASINSVVLWASRPTEENRLDQTSLDVLSIYATNDGIYSAEVIEESRAHLPENTVWVEIEGGNHYQFGWYQDDHAPVDGEAQISRQEQMQQIVSATVAFLSDRVYPYRK
jgi:pimeloyl-ACP methyl ester carboxylesterase